MCTEGQGGGCFGTSCWSAEDGKETRVFPRDEQEVAWWGSLWGDGEEGVSPRELQKNCTGCFATQEVTERKLIGKHFLCKYTVESGDICF